MKQLRLLLAGATLAGAIASTAAHGQADDTSPTATVHMRESAFEAESITVKTGQPVVFVNDDPISHNVTVPSKDIRSGDIAGGKSWKYVFTEPGEYRYLCTYHPGMQGKIVAK